MKEQEQIQYVNLLNRFNESGPYYTSYPVLAAWQKEYTNVDYIESLKDFFAKEGKDAPLHLYVHIPFCAKLCWYCICNMTISSDRARIQEFLDYLFREIDMLREFFDANEIKPNFKEIHLGGGTPSHLFNDQFTMLANKLSSLVDLSTLDEFAMEIDPRTTDHEKLKHYASLGVRRISFGVQDFDPKVQEAINRVQPAEMLEALLTPEIRKLFTGFNFDLLFGLPHQTRDTLRNTLKIVERLSPERVSFYKYAHIPDVRKHMKLIKEVDLPPAADLPLMFTESVQTLIDQGYEWVGIDFFAKKTDDLGKAVKNGTVWRNFNGFTPGRTNHLIGVGPTSTGAFGSYYSQSYFEFPEYYKSIDSGQFPTLRGYKMNTDDLIRREIMFALLCYQFVDLDEIDRKYGINHKEYFSVELKDLQDQFLDSELLEMPEGQIKVTRIGRFFLRNICKVFDLFTRGKEYKIPGPVLSNNKSMM